jgi:hypothetical protein
MTVIDHLKAKIGLMDAEELALRLGMNKDKLYRKAKGGAVPHYRVFGCVKYDPLVIAEWLRGREVQAR